MRDGLYWARVIENSLDLRIWESITTFEFGYFINENLDVPISRARMVALGSARTTNGEQNLLLESNVA